MCSEFEPKIKMKRVTIVHESGRKIGPVTVMGPISETQTEFGPAFIARVYGKKGLLPPSGSNWVVFSAVYSNLKG